MYFRAIILLNFMKKRKYIQDFDVVRGMTYHMKRRFWLLSYMYLNKRMLLLLCSYDFSILHMTFSNSLIPISLNDITRNINTNMQMSHEKCGRLLLIITNRYIYIWPMYDRCCSIICLKNNTNNKCKLGNRTLVIIANINSRFNISFPLVNVCRSHYFHI